MRICDAHRQPTIMRLNTSMMKQTYATPAQVGTNVRSVTQSRFGAVAVNSRLTRSGCLAEAGSGLVVVTRFETGRALDARCAHQPAGLVSTDLDPRHGGRLPELTGPVNAIIRLPEPDEPRRHNSVADRPRRRRTILRGVIGARSYLQQTADGLDSERATLDDVVLVRVDERDYFRCWRSSSAPKKDAARFKISLARRSSRFSCSSSRILCASSVLTPGA